MYLTRGFLRLLCEKYSHLIYETLYLFFTYPGDGSRKFTSPIDSPPFLSTNSLIFDCHSRDLSLTDSSLGLTRWTLNTLDSIRETYTQRGAHVTCILRGAIVHRHSQSILSRRYIERVVSWVVYDLYVFFYISDNTRVTLD